MSPTRPDTDDETLSIAGLIATGVAGELARPIRDLREKLAIMVDALDHHVANAKGPSPYPWKSVGELREQLAEAYLLSRSIARLSGDLATAVAPPSQIASGVDVNKVVEAALNLASHKVTESTEVYVDYGTVPAARGSAPRLVLALARLIIRAADSTSGGSIRILSRRDETRAVLQVVDSGVHEPDRDDRAIAEVRRLLGDGDATVEVRREQGEGTLFELRLPLGT